MLHFQFAERGLIYVSCFLIVLQNRYSSRQAGRQDGLDESMNVIT
jgi:hypothetical protein